MNTSEFSTPRAPNSPMDILVTVGLPIPPKCNKKHFGGYTQNRGERENKQQINEFNLLEDKDKL